MVGSNLILDSTLSLRRSAFVFCDCGNLGFEVFWVEYLEGYSIFERVGIPLSNFPPKTKTKNTKQRRTKTIKAIATLLSVARNDGMKL